MNDLYSVIVGMIYHAYELVLLVSITLIPAKMLLKAFYGKKPL